jgi:hypothetical protein
VFFEFNQNNSGGGFDYDAARGIGRHVIVEARNEDEANDRAGRIGLYFDGADDYGPDCSCCGDRWYRAWAHSGTDTPIIYGEPVDEEYRLSLGKDTPEVFVHYADGRIAGYEAR